MRFDQVELQTVPLVLEDESLVAPRIKGAPRIRRLVALLTDLSLFAAMALALVPLLPQPHTWLPVAALAGFVIVFSYYYFVGSWLLWGKTVGGAIFDVRVIPREGGAISLRAASLRWAAFCLSLITAGIGFLLGLPDQVSQTRSV